MGLILGIIIAIGTLVWCFIIAFANGMASAPSAQNAIPIWPSLLIGEAIAAVLIFTHYHSIGW